MFVPCGTLLCPEDELDDILFRHLLNADDVDDADDDSVSGMVGDNEVIGFLAGISINLHIFLYFVNFMGAVLNVMVISVIKFGANMQ